MLFGFYLTGQMVFSWMSTCVFGPYVMRTCLGEPGAGGEVDTWQGCIFFRQPLYVEMVLTESCNIILPEAKARSIRQRVSAHHLGRTHWHQERKTNNQRTSLIRKGCFRSFLVRSCSFNSNCGSWQ